MRTLFSFGLALTLIPQAAIAQVATPEQSFVQNVRDVATAFELDLSRLSDQQLATNGSAVCNFYEAGGTSDVLMQQYEEGTAAHLALSIIAVNAVTYLCPEVNDGN